jgi:hypothetical protein
MQVINQLIESEEVNELINKIEPKELRGDFKGHLYLTLIDYDKEKILKARREGYLNKLIGRIIISQFKSNTSDFYRIYRNQGFRKGIIFINPILSNENEQIEYEETREEWIIDKVEEINNILRSREYYHTTLFRMYFFDDMTYQQIEKMTGINFQSVRISVLKTIKFIKQRIKYD